jgi:hypothetical protein
MFENSTNDSSELVLHKVEKLQPSEKIKERFANNSQNEENTTYGMNKNFHTNHVQSEDSISPDEEEEEEELRESEEEFYLNQQQYKGDGFLHKIDKTNFTLKEQQLRSINGDDCDDDDDDDNNDKEAQNNAESLENTTSGSVSASSSMSSPVALLHKDKEAIVDLVAVVAADACKSGDLIEFNREERENEVLLHDDFLDSHKLINFDDDDDKRFEEGGVNEDQDEDEEEDAENDSDVIKSTPKSKKKKDIIAFTEMNNVKEKFERRASEDTSHDQLKPMRSITPPREGANQVEIENHPAERQADIASNYDKIQDVLPEHGYIRSRKEMFSSALEANASSSSTSSLPGIKAITPPRDDMLKRTLREVTPERNENVCRESDTSDEYMPEQGHAKQTAALFLVNKSIQERSGITLEGELAEKGIAKSRLALFNDPNAFASDATATSGVLASEQESQIMKNASGIAKDRLNLFKNLETRTSPSRDIKKLKEFTPPPQLDPHMQRQYIIIDKDTPNNGEDEMTRESNLKEEFMPESGLAKSRMKQYLESTSHQAENTTTPTEDESTKGLAKSLLAKWKSMENVKDKEGSPEPSHPPKTKRSERQSTPGGTVIEYEEDEQLPQSGNAKSLLNKWQNIDSSSQSSSSAARERRGIRAFTPPPPEELERNRNNDNQEDSEMAHVKSDVNEELALLRGQAKNTLAKFESQPAESNINALYCEEEVIPSAGHAKSLKSKFLNLEKEAAKVETSSSKMNYVPKKFTSATAPAKQATPSSNNLEAKSNAPPPKQNLNNGLLTPVAATANIPSTNNNNNNNTEKCCVCEKTVYAMEKIEADKKVYHKLCFKCTSCSCTLKLGNYSSIKQTLYCTPHYIQLFSRNGNYDEGFGLENYKRKWLQRSSSELTASTN